MPDILNMCTPKHSNGLKTDEAGISLPSQFSKSTAVAAGRPCACVGTDAWGDMKDLQKLQKATYPE